MYSKTLAALAITSTALISAQAHAGAANSPASQCVKWTNGDVTPLLSASAIYNPSATQWMRVDCPVERTDFDGFLHNAAVEGSWIRAVDRHYSANVSCQLISYSRNSDGSASFWGTPVRTSSGSGNSTQHLNTGGLAGDNSISHLYFSCNVPPTYSGNQSGLVTYQVSQ